MTRPTYIVTGAAGFIGAKVCEALMGEGASVVALDNLNDFYDVRLKDYRLNRLFGETKTPSWPDNYISSYRGAHGIQSGNISFWNVDIEDAAALAAIFKQHKPDAVFNLAARAGVRDSVRNPQVYFRTNTLGTVNILECMRASGVEKLVMASTSALYAGCDVPFVETHAVDTPRSPYAASKRSAELVAYTYHTLYNIDISILRYFTVYGPAGRPDMAPMRFIKWIDDGTPVILHGDGSQRRDFTYIDDIVCGTIAARRRMGYQIINLGGGTEPVAMREIIAWIEQELGKKALVTGGPAQAADMIETQASITKASRLLDWTPKVSTKEGFRRCIAWQCSNREWLKGIRM